MKYLKFAAVTLLIVALVAVAIAYLRRDSIARDIANSVLEGQDITVTDLSVELLQTDRVEFSEIVLQRGDGTRIEITGLSFPLSFPSVRPEHVSIDELLVNVAQDDAQPSRYAETLRTILDLPENMPSTAITIARLSIPDQPPVTGIVWAVADRMQRLSFSVESATRLTGLVELERLDDDAFRATVSAAADDGEADDALTLDLRISADGDAFVIDGPATIIAAPWLPMLKSMEILPQELVSLHANLQGPIEIRVDDDSGRSPLRSSLSLPDTASAQYRVGDDILIDVQLIEADPVELSFEFPSLEWTARIGESELSLGINSDVEFPARISNMVCRSIPSCVADVRVDAGAMQAYGLDIGGLEFATSIEITKTESILVDVSEVLVLNLMSVASPTLSAESIRVTDFSGARLNIEDDSWRADAGMLELALENVTDGEDLAATLPVSFKNLSVTEGANSIVADFSVPAGTGTLAYGDISLLIPAVDGKLERQSDTISSVFAVTDASGSVSAELGASHDTTSGRGNVQVRQASLSFDQQKLSERPFDWPYDWDLVAGTWTAEGNLNWTVNDDGTEFVAAMEFVGKGLAGNYNDVAFSGLNTTLPVRFDSPSTLTVSAARIDAALLDVGVPLEQLTVDFFIDAEQTIQVDSLTLSALGGRIVADPFRYAAESAENELLVRPESIQLQFMADLAGFETIEINGSLSGMLPVSIRGKTITIKDGRLESDPPGGVIRYGAGAAVDAAAPGSGLTIVSQALTNFEFDSLTADVNYTENGDLTLQMRMTGINPDLDPKQPINLNLGVENNIPQLLRSLQAIRSIEDVLERRTTN